METTNCSTNLSCEKSVMPFLKRQRSAIITGAIVLLAAIWYLFRPELLFINKNVNEAFPVASNSAMSEASTSAPVTQGMFHSGAHETKGTAAIYEMNGGARVLRLTGFQTSNGPDVHVLLGKAADATDNDTVKAAGYVDLGSLKGNIGDQNYEIPADVTPSDFKSVTIWCKRFSVNFGTAPLQIN